MSSVVGVMALLLWLAIAGYGTRRWLTGLLWLGPGLVVIAVIVATIVLVEFPAYEVASGIAYIEAGIFLAGWGIGGFVASREFHGLEPSRNWWSPIIMALLGVVLIFAGLSMQITRVSF